TANLTTGVWFGNDDARPMKNVTGGALPAQAWHEFLVAAHEGAPVAHHPGSWQPALVAPAVPEVSTGEPAVQARATAARKPRTPGHAIGWRADGIDQASGPAGRGGCADEEGHHVDPRYPDRRLTPRLSVGESPLSGSRQSLRVRLDRRASIRTHKGRSGLLV